MKAFQRYLPDPGRAGLHEAFQFLSVRPYVRPSVNPYVSNSFSLLLLSQYTLDPQYFYRFRTPYKMTIRGADYRCPRPPPPPPFGGGGGGKIYFGGLLLMDHSDHQRVKYFCEALGFKYHLGYPWGLGSPPTPLAPLDPYRGGGAYGGARGA